MFVDPCIIVQFKKKIQQDATNVSEFLLFHIYIKLNMFRRYTAHHQEPKTALVASDFLYVEGRWTCSWWTLSGTV